MNNQNTSSALNQAIVGAQELLTSFAFQDELLGDLTTGFGDNYNQQSALSLITQWQTGNFSSIPEIEIRSSAEINGANGAYSIDTNKIYIAEEYLLANADNINMIVDVVLEEYGHYVDAQINVADTRGDEGNIFARLVQGESLSQQELAVLRAEDDTATVTLDGQVIEIEQNNPIKVTNNNDSGSGSLRQAIINAGNTPGVDTIDLTSVSGTINLNSSLILNSGNDINFVDDGNSTISGQNARQIITVKGANVNFSRLTFANGLAQGGHGIFGGGGGLGAGGAMFIDTGNVTLNNVTFKNNKAIGGSSFGLGSFGGTSNGGNGSFLIGIGGNGVTGISGETGSNGSNGFKAGDITHAVFGGTAARGGSGGSFGIAGTGFGSGGGTGGGGGAGTAFFETSTTELPPSKCTKTSFKALRSKASTRRHITIRTHVKLLHFLTLNGAKCDSMIVRENYAHTAPQPLSKFVDSKSDNSKTLEVALGLVLRHQNSTYVWGKFRLITKFGPTEPLWIGLTDEVQEGQFKWASGEDSTYTNWNPGEPNNSGNEDYVGMNWGSPGKWNDFPTSTSSFQGIIENKFYEYNGSKYLLTGYGTWEQAQEQARSLGGNLVTINSQAEQDWLVNTFGGSESLWIGLTDEVTEGQFKWASGETSTYTNWSPGKPDNTGNEDYVGMYSGGKWNDFRSTHAQRGIIEIKQYDATGSSADSQFFVLGKPEKFDLNVRGGFGPDIFQLRSYDGITNSQQVYGSQGSDIFNISIEASNNIVGLDFNAGKLQELAELLVEPDWDVMEARLNADLAHASIGLGIDYAAAVAGVFANLDPTGIAGGAVDAVAASAHYTNDIANISINHNLDIEEYQNNLAGIGDFFEGQGSNGWGTVNVTQKRSIVEILDFQPGIDTITLPKLTGNDSYKYTLVSGINGTGVEVAYNNQTNEASTFLRIYIDPTLLPIVQGQNVGLEQFIESLFTNNATNGVIGKTRNNTNKVAVSGQSYTGTIAGDYIYVAENNPTDGAVQIYGLAGNDLLAGRKNGSNEIYAGDGNDFIVPGRVNDIIDGGTGYDQVNYSQNTVGISILSSNSSNFKNVESVIGTVYNDTIDFSDLSVSPEDGVAINLEGRAGDDNLIGSQYRDVILGEDGDDRLVGNGGDDVLTGGAGQDTFVFNTLSTEISKIEDFEVFNDIIEIDNAGFGATSKSEFSFDNISGALSFGSQQFATLENLPSALDVSRDIVLV